ncbi:MAG: signal transduction histidine kinase/FixJ family two-component response regulator [Alteromonadaceae bacterium]|jgi:signal transduction histidine kinase/FixJ family two-component response regulator
MAADLIDDNDFFFADEDEIIRPTKDPFKVLIVDDEPGIHQVTALALQELTYEERPLTFLHAYSGQEANSIIEHTPDIALVLLDVVMETQTAGLDVAKYIREELNNHLTRIILRTGQPGYLPEAEIIRNYDINDYKNKTELSKAKLYSTVITALRGYSELIGTESYRQALSKIMDSSEQLLTTTNFNQFHQRLCDDLQNLLPLGKLFDRQQVSYVLFKHHDNINNVIRHSDNISNIDEWFEKFRPIRESAFKGGKRIYQSLAILPLDNCKSDEPLFLAIDNNEILCKQEQQLLGIFSHYLEVASTNLALQLSLSSLNADLEAKVDTRTRQLSVEKQKAEQANQAKSQFLANMSHEIRTPMNAILGFTQLLIRSKDIKPDNKETLYKVEKACNHLMDIINDVLEISKIEAGAMEVRPTAFDLVGLLEDICQMFSFRCEQKSLQWQFNNSIDEETQVIGDQSKFRQVLINLLGNAVKFTDSGFVKLSVSSPEPHRYFISVQDSGPGMQIEEIATLFTNFSQGRAGAEKGGTGLGLAISYKQVHLMGGTLEVDSVFSRGSHFYFTLPFEHSSEKLKIVDNSKVESVKLKAGLSHSILIVDDVEANRDVLGSLLKETGVDVDYANDGKEALVKIWNTRYDMVFMDILMPVMRGDEAIDVIRKEINQPNLICVAISAFSLAHEIKYYLDIGFDAFIPKPFLFSDIYHSLSKFSPGRFETVIAVDESADHKNIEPLALTQCQLTEAVHQDLSIAAELNRMSYLKEAINNIMANDNTQQGLCLYLLEFVDNYDMDGFLAALKEIDYV